MSRVNTVTQTIRLVPSTYTRSNTQYVTVTNETNMYSNTSSTTYASIRGRNSSNTSRKYYCYISGFNFDIVPDDVSVTSFSVKIKAYKNSYQRTGTGYRPYLASTASYSSTISNTELTEDLTTTGGTIYTFPTSGTTWSYIKNCGSGFTVVIPLNPSSNQYPYVYVYGIEIEVNYPVETTEYQVSVTNNASGVTVSPAGTNNWTAEGGSQVITFTNVSDIATLSVVDNNVNVTSKLVNTGTRTYTYTISNISADHTITISTVTAYNITASSEVPDLATVSPSSGRAGQGSNFDIIIVPTDINAIKVYDNNTDVTSQVHKKLISTTTTGEFYPAQYISGNTNINANYPTSNALNPATNTSYARFYANSSSNAQNFIYGFSINLPTNAVIISVSCQVHAYTNNGSYITERTVQLYSGTTAKGSSITLPTSNTTSTITDCGDWTVEELANVRLRFDYRSSSTSTTYRIDFYGATLTIEYEYEAESDTDYEYTVQNVQVAHTVVVREAPYFEITGSSTFDGKTIVGVPKHIYVSGSNYNVQLSGITNPYSFRLSDNGVDVTSSVIGNGASGIITVIPAQYVSGTFTASNTGNGLANTSSTTQAQFTVSTTAKYCIYQFGNLDIPTGVVIKSVTCKVKAYASSTSVTTRTVRLYCNGTAKGTAYTLPTSNSTFTLDVGELTATDLSNCQLRFDGQRSGYTNYYIYFYGAELTVEYEGGYLIQNITTDRALVLSEAPKYAVSGTSNFTGKSITGTGNVYHGDSITVTLTNITNVKSFKLYDNNVDVTSSVNTSDWNYSLTNVTAAHNLRLEEATKYAVTGTSNFSGTGFSGLGNVYQGDNITITLTGITNTYSFRLYDNDTDVTSSVNTSNWRYTISNAQGTHALRIEEAPYYSVTGVSNFDGVTITGTSNKKYQGESITVSLSGITDSTSYTLYDNDVNKTSSVNSSYQYTISNIQANHTIRVEENDYYLISGVSNFTSGARFSNLPKKVYTSGSSFTVTLTGITNQYSFNLFDNDVDVTSSISSNQYVISNITADHSLRIEEAPYYAVTATVTYPNASITGTSNKVYEGDSITVTLTGISDRDSFRLYDNGFEATDSVNSSYQYTISSINTNHELALEEIPHYSVSEGNSTLSGATLTGLSNKVYEGSDVTVTIEGVSDPYSIKLTDNGVDVSDKVIMPTAASEPTYTVETASGASYGFNLNTGTGYYTSANTGTDESAGVCVVNFDLPVLCRITIEYINYAEASYDFGVFGNIDSMLSNDYYAAGSGGATITDTDYKLACNTSAYNVSTVQTLTYDIPAGQHYIYVKYSKDDGTSSNNDSLQFKIASIEPLEVITSVPEYIITDISENHVLVVSLQDTITVTTSSSYNGASLSPASSTVYKGEPIELTLTVSDISLVSVRVTNSKNSMVTGIFTDNGNGTYTGILTVRENSTVTVIQKVTYNITCTDNATNGNITPTGTQSIDGGYDVEYVIESDYFNRIYLKDNNVIVNDLIERHYTSQTTVTFVPSEYDSVNSNPAGIDSTNVAANGLTNADSTTRATFTTNTTANSETNIYYNFDCSSIPANAIIDSVTCEFKATISSNYFNTRIGQLCYGTTKKGSPTTVTNTSVNQTVYKQTIADCGTWTRAELNDIKILIQGIRGTQTNNFSNSFFGATLSITYHTDYYGYTIENVSAAHTLVLSDRPTYQITASSSTDKATISPVSSTVYEANEITFEITTSDIHKIKLLDNNVNVTENISIVEGNYLYVIENITGAHTLLIKNKLTIFLKQLNAWTEYSKIYKKKNNEWFEQDEAEGLFDTNKIYILK